MQDLRAIPDHTKDFYFSDLKKKGDFVELQRRSVPIISRQVPDSRRTGIAQSLHRQDPRRRWQGSRSDEQRLPASSFFILLFYPIFGSRPLVEIQRRSFLLRRNISARRAGARVTLRGLLKFVLLVRPAESRQQPLTFSLEQYPPSYERKALRALSTAPDTKHT
jgi:hypothetical protein